ncbi:hypothetical protein ACFV5G_15490 [Streptomyces sp. NPDC059766]|uniref:hypothetical protein n=1 Tax=Streptomyces sp. NPDC059766 TaxID=3346940 RepID=UPI00365BA2CC
MADTRRQLRSGTVILGGMGLLATALTACSSAPDQRCVDRNSYRLGKGYQVVSDKNCKSTTSKTSVNGAWYYGGKEKKSWVTGGSFTKPSKSSGSGSRSGGSSDDDSHKSGVHRGGFGGGHGSSGG